MVSPYVIAVDGLDEAGNFEATKASLKVAALRAINRTLDRSRTRSSDSIRNQVAYPASYLSPRTGRLSVTKRATRNDLEGIIRGRDRPTSLARFAQGTPRRGGPVVLQVKPGIARFMRRAFLIRLRAGSADINTRSNLGLAIRLRAGERIENKRSQVQLARGLYLLYGPSVNQVFESVAEEEASGREIPNDFEREFFRLLEL